MSAPLQPRDTATLTQQINLILSSHIESEKLLIQAVEGCVFQSTPTGSDGKTPFTFEQIAQPNMAAYLAAKKAAVNIIRPNTFSV